MEPWYFKRKWKETLETMKYNDAAFNLSINRLPLIILKKTYTEHGNMDFYPGKLSCPNQLDAVRSPVLRKMAERQNNRGI